jgi:hypothetical protein
VSFAVICNSGEPALLNVNCVPLFCPIVKFVDPPSSLNVTASGTVGYVITIGSEDTNPDAVNA